MCQWELVERGSSIRVTSLLSELVTKVAAVNEGGEKAVEG